jgi:thiamine biosynthesis lipoprotein
MIAIGAQSATVVGPSGWLCDGMATALMVVGEDGAKYFSQPELAGYKLFVIGRHENSAWSI